MPRYLLIFADVLVTAALMIYIYCIRKTIFRRRRRRHLFVFLIACPAGENRKAGDSSMTPIQAPAGAVTSVPQNVAVVLDIVFLEADDNGNILPGKGPFTTQVDDPSGAVSVSADQRSLSVSGSGPAGDVTVTITDTGNTLVGKAVLSVTAITPPPPPAPTQAAVFFVPEAPAPAPATTAAVRGTGTPEVQH